MQKFNKKLLSLLVLVGLVSFFVISGLRNGLFVSSDHVGMVYIARSILLIIWVQFYVMSMLYFDRIRSIVVKYFSAKSHPINLAIFRIVIFYELVITSLGSQAYLFSNFPKELLYPPPGLENISQVLPINSEAVSVIGGILFISAFLAMVGFCTKISSWVAVICGIYYMGIQQLYGKVDHVHFIIWAAAILAASACADIFSVDAFVSRLRKKRNGEVSAVAVPSIQYGLPIRIIFILFGILYFFPGFWKFYSGGLDWIISDNFINRMYARWFDLNGWLPIFRIDQYPVLCQILAGAAIFFECAFIFLIFFDRWRYWAVAGGLGFHIMTQLFMNINFLHLMLCYIIFFQWEKILSWFKKIILRITTLPVVDNQEVTEPKNTRTVIIVGAVLIIANIYCGIMKIDSWPFSVYPTFDRVLMEHYVSSVDLVLFDEKGKEIPFNKHEFTSRRIDITHFISLIERISMEREDLVREKKLLALLKVWASFDPEINRAKTVRMYRNLYSTLPEDYGKDPVEQTLVLAVKVN